MRLRGMEEIASQYLADAPKSLKTWFAETLRNQAISSVNIIIRCGGIGQQIENRTDVGTPVYEKGVVDDPNHSIKQKKAEEKLAKCEKKEEKERINKKKEHNGKGCRLKTDHFFKKVEENEETENEDESADDLSENEDDSEDDLSENED